MGGTYLGVNIAEIDAARAKELKLKDDYGVEITRVEETVRPEKAGLKAGDVVQIQRPTSGRHGTIRQNGAETPPGREVKLTISRNGATQTFDGGAR